MKKLIALLLALFCAFSLVGCSLRGMETRSGNNSSDAPKANETVQALQKAIDDLDLEGIKAVVDEPDKLTDTLAKIDLNTFKGNLKDEWKGEAVQPLVAAVDTKMKDAITCKIDEAANKDAKTNTYTAVISVEIPKVNNYQTLLDDAVKAVDSKAIGEALAQDEKLKNETESVIKEKITEKVIEAAIKNIKEKSLDTETKKFNLVLVEKDGNWLVSVKDSKPTK
ncbi:MAG: hypothetical protein IJF61_04160 [Clostridia bacterium]|nr:hypothetical protein [Clostridia bacterium]